MCISYAGGMQITHLGHAAVLVEVADRRILFDPGNFTEGWYGLSDLDAICVTHLHPDHIDVENLHRVLDTSRGARLYVEPGVLASYDLPEGTRPMPADASVDLGGVRIDAVGGLHAVIHRDIPRIGNVGLVVSAEGEPRFFHPGDCLDAIPEGIDVLASPMMGPWAAMKENVDFLRQVGAPHAFGIHEALLSERGWSLYQRQYGALTETEVHDLRDREPWTPGNGMLGA